jgi:solute:Na+ symporter, SSS family
MKLPVIDLIVFLVYMVGIVVFGSSFYSRNKDPGQFTSGGGKLPAWVVGMSIFATFVSSISFLALPGKAYQSNWNAFVFSLSIPVASVMAVVFFVPLYRGINSISAYTYLEIRFGPWARFYASVCYILTQIMRTGSILYLMALPLNAVFGWSIPWVIVITGLSVVIYSMLGGIKAVIWTDAIQGIILIGGAMACLIVLLFSIPEGPKQIIETGVTHHKFWMGPFNASVSQSTFWVMLLYGLFINLQNYGIDQNYVQRYMTTKSDKDAKRSALLGSLLYIPVSLLFFIIGTSLFAYYAARPELLPANLQDLSRADKVFPYFIANGLPAGLSGLVIASVFAAGMSTISTSVNGTATIVLVDFYKRYIHLQAGDKKSMRVLYLSSVIFGILGISVALAMISVKSALDTWWMLASVFSGGMLGLFLLGYFARKATSMNAAIGVICGVFFILWMSLSPLYFTEGNLIRFRSPFHANLTIVMGTTVIFLVGFLLTKFKMGLKPQNGQSPCH